LKDLSLDPISPLWLIDICRWIAAVARMRQRGREVAEVVLHKPTDIMKAVNIIVKVRDVISDMFNRRIQLFQLVFIHFDNSYPRGEVRRREKMRGEYHHPWQR
jgi:hypothetical protein